MARSFEDSLKAMQEQENAKLNTYAVSTMSLDAEEETVEEEIIEEVVVQPRMMKAFSLRNSDNWILDGHYLYYEEYSDEVVSTIDEQKNIVIDESQINITQETNSQFIPFEMNRYYDGFDLKNTTILIHFVNKDGYEDYANPVNVYYNDDRIKFAWLVDNRATAIEGKVKFEIQAVGVNSKGDDYIWKTKPNGELNILKSLSGNGVIVPDKSWITSFMSQVTEQVALAQEYAQQAQASVDSLDDYVGQVEQIVAEAQAVVDSAKEELEATVAETIDEKVASALGGYYTKEEVDDIVNNIDISEQLDEVRKEIANIDGLANFDVEYNGSVMTFYNGETVIKEIEINSDPSIEWTTSYTASIQSKIDDAKSEVQGNLDTYSSTTDEKLEAIDADLESIHGNIDSLPETLASDYYTKTVTDETFATKAELTNINNSVSTLGSSIETNKTNISTLSDKIVEVETVVNGIDKSPRLTYEATYDEEYTYTLWEIEGEGTEGEKRNAKNQFKIQGGSGSGSSSVLKIEYITTSPLVVTVDDIAIIKYNFSGQDSSGDAVTDGVATWKVAGRTVATTTATAGENEFDITKYLTLGTQKVQLSITDDAGSLVTKSWTVQKIDVRIESTFNDKLTYPIGTVSFDYTPYGAISKDIYFVLDGKEIGKVTTSASGIPMAYTIPVQEHGAHLLDVYMTATVNNNTITSNHIAKDIIWYDTTSTIPVIGCVQQNFTAKQYATTNISYTVYDPSTETPTVVLAVDGNIVSTVTMNSNTETWQFKSTEVGTHTLTITCGETVKTLTVNIEKLDIVLEPVTAGLVFDFDPSGKSNNDADRLWHNDTVAMTVSDNFDWINGGYQLDANGDQYFCIKAGTSAEIDYKLFADDAKRNGKEFKLVFKTTNVQNPEALFLTCMDNTTGTDHIGVEMKVHEANVYAQSGKLNLPYSEEDIIEFEFNISKNTEEIPMIMGYEDGVSTMPMVYDDSHNFTQTTPKTISLGSEYCDLHIYRFKVYNSSLNARGILNNFIADARNAEEMVDRYNRNQIYDENQNLDPYVLAEKCPWLRVIIISAPYFTNNKSDKVPNTTIEYIHKGGDPVLDNWVATDCLHSGQGTSSNNYGASGRNLDLIMKRNKDFNNSPVITLGDGKSTTNKISLTRNSVPVNYLNVKVNIASSENANNALMAKRYNEFNPYKLPYVREEGYDLDSIKTTMEFFNTVIFIQETNEDISTHREFADTNIHYYAFGNVGDSKKTDDTRLVDPDDKYECIVELMDVELPLSDFPKDTMYNAMGYKEDETTKEKIYTWAKNENLGILYEKVGNEYVLTKDTEVDLNKTYYVDILEHDDFSEDFTYGWRYIWEDGTDEQNAEVFDYCKQKWIEVYRFITTSTDEEFVRDFDKYFVMDSVLYYYLFTMRYMMVDNRAKNLFFGYSKTGELNANGEPIRKWHLAFGYDMDKNMSI